MFSEGYVRIILALAPFMVCLALSLDSELWKKRWWWLGGASLFAASVVSSVFAVWGCLPWLILTFGLAVNHLRKPRGGLSELALLASALYLPVGGVWALFAQLKLQPLGFSGIIVLLTGVHFHYAGFALPRLSGLWLSRQSIRTVYSVATVGIIAGVPLVAIGITTSQLQMSPWIEVVAVSILAFSAFVLSLGQLVWALKTPLPTAARGLFLLGGFSLVGGMVLATIYGWRSVFPVAWATIPTMYAVHGTLNSLGFCIPGFLAWHQTGLPPELESTDSILEIVDPLPIGVKTFQEDPAIRAPLLHE